MATVNPDSVAQDQIKAFVERIMRLREEERAIKGDIREIYAEAKGNGFDKTVLGKLVLHVEQQADSAKANAAAEQDALLDLYISAYYGRASHTHAHAREGQPDHDPETGEIIDIDALHADPERMYAAAVALVRCEKKCSPSLLQRRLSVGYNKACYLIERMEDEGIVSPARANGVREIINANSTSDSPIGEEAGEAETGETLSASPANHQAETPNQSTDASQERAQTATGVGTSGDNLGSSSRSSATAKTGVPTDQSQAPGDGQSQHNSDVRVASVDAPISQPVSEAPSLASADRSGGHLAPSSSRQAVSAPVTPSDAPVSADRTKPHPWCRVPKECGVHGSWNFMCGECLRHGAEREAARALQ